MSDFKHLGNDVYEYKGKRYSWRELFDKTDFFEVVLLPQLRKEGKVESDDNEGDEIE